MGGRRILSDDQVDLACNLREKGMSCQQISNYFAARGVTVSAGSISWQCLKHGADLPLDRRKPQCGAQPGLVYRRGAQFIRTFTASEDAMLIELEGLRLRVCEISKRMGRKPNTIRGRLATLARKQAREEDFTAASGFAQ